MKLVKKILISSVLGYLSSVSNSFAADLKVTVTDIGVMQGNLMVILFDSAEAFEGKGKPVNMARVAVTQGQHQLTFSDVQAGTYGVKLFHDENNNGKMDTNLLGIPSEGYGFSNNGGAFGPATFKEAAFSVADNTEISIKLR